MLARRAAGEGRFHETGHFRSFPATLPAVVDSYTGGATPSALVNNLLRAIEDGVTGERRNLSSPCRRLSCDSFIDQRTLFWRYSKFDQLDSVLCPGHVSDNLPICGPSRHVWIRATMIAFVAQVDTLAFSLHPLQVRPRRAFHRCRRRNGYPGRRPRRPLRRRRLRSPARPEALPRSRSGSR